VVGEGEIDCDEYGRILVRFHWDLENAFSMRCRVSQNWASQGWGGMVIPRIGMEVVVEFLEGDPDKPLVTGCVYNGRNMPPYDLPANRTKSVFRTDSHLSPERYGFNELSFEDEKGREEVFLRASRDLTVKVDQHATTRIDDNEVRSVGGHLLSKVEKARNETVGGSYVISVGGGPGGATARNAAIRSAFAPRPTASAWGRRGIAATSPSMPSATWR
jgi:type VI secretion system secreted protein VgrG